MKFTAPVAARLDGDAELVRRNHEQRLLELANTPVAGAFVIRGVELPSGVEVSVSHRLGRSPSYVKESAIRGGLGGAGAVFDLGTSRSSGAPIDRAQTVVLRADGYGGTIIVDVLVVP